MLTALTIRNFKLFTDVAIDLGERVVFIGPNNSGKTSALQALALWDVGVKRWLERRGSGAIPAERAGVTINRQDLLAIPVPSANLLWRELRVREGERHDGKSRTRNVRIEIGVAGSDDQQWQCWLVRLCERRVDLLSPSSWSRQGPHDGAGASQTLASRIFAANVRSGSP